jgi:hypothetical protein
MRVLLVRSAHSAGSVHYRVDEPVRAIRESAADLDIRVVSGIPSTVHPTADGEGTEVTDVDAGDADLVVFQLPKTKSMLQAIRLLRTRGVAVVVEVDDLLSGVPYGHAGHDALVRKGMARVFLECARGRSSRSPASSCGSTPWSPRTSTASSPSSTT